MNIPKTGVIENLKGQRDVFKGYFYICPGNKKRFDLDWFSIFILFFYNSTKHIWLFSLLFSLQCPLVTAVN